MTKLILGETISLDEIFTIETFSLTRNAAAKKFHVGGATFRRFLDSLVGQSHFSWPHRQFMTLATTIERQEFIQAKRLEVEHRLQSLGNNNNSNQSSAFTTPSLAVKKNPHSIASIICQMSPSNLNHNHHQCSSSQSSSRRAVAVAVPTTTMTVEEPGSSSSSSSSSSSDEEAFVASFFPPPAIHRQLPTSDCSGYGDREEKEAEEYQSDAEAAVALITINQQQQK